MKPEKLGVSLTERPPLVEAVPAVEDRGPSNQLEGSCHRCLAVSETFKLRKCMWVWPAWTFFFGLRDSRKHQPNPPHTHPEIFIEKYATRALFDALRAITPTYTRTPLQFEGHSPVICCDCRNKRPRNEPHNSCTAHKLPQSRHRPDLRNMPQAADT